MWHLVQIILNGLLNACKLALGNHIILSLYARDMFMYYVFLLDAYRRTISMYFNGNHKYLFQEHYLGDRYACAFDWKYIWYFIYFNHTQLKCANEYRLWKGNTSGNPAEWHTAYEMQHKGNLMNIIFNLISSIYMQCPVK